MKPTISDVHIDAPLTDVSIAYFQQATGFVAPLIFPNIPVQKKSNYYFTFDRKDFNRNQARKRAPSTESAGGQFTITKDQRYECDVIAYHYDIDDQVEAAQDDPLNIRRTAARLLSNKMLIKREVDFVDTFFKGGVWTHDYDGVASSAGTTETIQWNDSTASDPIKDIHEAIATILETTGFPPNTLVLGYRTYVALRNHPDIIERVKYVQNIGANQVVQVGTGALANLFFGDEVADGRIFVMKSIQELSTEGASVGNSAFIGGKHALLCYSNRNNPTIEMPSAGYTFSWQRYLGVTGAEGNTVYELPMPELRSSRIEGEMAYDQKLVSADLGFFWESIVA